MGSSSQPSHTTQTTEPPAFIQPYMQYGAEQGRALYETGGPQYYPGNTVVPFSQQTEAALAGTEARARNGSPVVNAAQNYATNLLGSSPTSQFGSGSNPYASSHNPYGGASNPHLDAVFNHGADAITNRIQSDFAGSGRNISAGAPLAADELGSLYAGIYAPAYENERSRQFGFDTQQLGIGAQGYESERDRMAQDIQQQRGQQFGAASLAPNLGAQDYLDLQALGGVGGQVEDLAGNYMQDQSARWDYGQNAPQMNLDNYIARITGSYPGANATSTTPTYRNRAAGALGGAASAGGLAMTLGATGPVGWTAAGIGALLGAYG